MSAKARDESANDVSTEALHVLEYLAKIYEGLKP